MKVKQIIEADRHAPSGFSANGSYSFMCIGCGEYHVINTATPLPNKAIWKFNGDLNKPTFEPSIDYKSGKFADPNWIDSDGLQSVHCHFRIIDGNIIFMNDCSHDKAGKTFELPDIT